MSNFKELYYKTVQKNLQKKFNYQNIHEIPKILKIVLSTGLGLDAQNKNILGKAINEIRQISGQHPKLTLSKKSISNFKLRKGLPIGLFVTLRRNRMYDFLERLIKLILPRIRDFKGVPQTSFDSRANYTFGIHEQLIFPELNFENIDKRRGYQISIVTSTNNIKESKELLHEFKFPFAH